jgi:hypothetical protein
VASLAAEPLAMPPSRIVALSVLARLRTRRGHPDSRASLEEAWELAVQTGDLQRTWPVAAGRAEQARHSSPAAMTQEVPNTAVQIARSEFYIGRVVSQDGLGRPATRPPS